MPDVNIDDVKMFLSGLEKDHGALRWLLLLLFEELVEHGGAGCIVIGLLIAENLLL